MDLEFELISRHVQFIEAYDKASKVEPMQLKELVHFNSKYEQIIFEDLSISDWKVFYQEYNLAKENLNYLKKTFFEYSERIATLKTSISLLNQFHKVLQQKLETNEKKHSLILTKDISLLTDAKLYSLIMNSEARKKELTNIIEISKNFIKKNCVHGVLLECTYFKIKFDFISVLRRFQFIAIWFESKSLMGNIEFAKKDLLASISDKELTELKSSWNELFDSFSSERRVFQEMIDYCQTEAESNIQKGLCKVLDEHVADEIAMSFLKRKEQLEVQLKELDKICESWNLFRSKTFH